MPKFDNADESAEVEELFSALESQTELSEPDVIVPGAPFLHERPSFSKQGYQSRISVSGRNRSGVIGRTTNLLATVKLNLERARFRVDRNHHYCFDFEASGDRERLLQVEDWFGCSGQSYLKKDFDTKRADLSRTWVAVFEAVLPDAGGITDSAADIMKRWRTVPASPGSQLKDFQTCASIYLMDGEARRDHSFPGEPVPVFHLRIVACSPLRRVHNEIILDWKKWVLRPGDGVESALRWAYASFGKTDLPETFLVQTPEAEGNSCGLTRTAMGSN